MRTEIVNGRLVVRDNPTLFWLFYSFFIMGGSTALYLSLSAAPDMLTAVLGATIGLGNLAGGIYMLKREPASVVEIDPSGNEIPESFAGGECMARKNVCIRWIP